MQQTQCSKTLTFKLQTLVNHPEASIQLSEHGKILKTRITHIHWFLGRQVAGNCGLPRTFCFHIVLLLMMMMMILVFLEQ
jgi:hypothetical protein